ncbi:MAG: hypothetical protein R8G66_24795 [Cytophagales bacterium]|nr:hypothetical protein [Cytophagales bacterium]
MKKLKKVIRITFMVLIILLAAAGAGFGAMLPNVRRYQDAEVQIELVEEREEEDEDQMKENME